MADLATINNDQTVLGMISNVEFGSPSSALAVSVVGDLLLMQRHVVIGATRGGVGESGGVPDHVVVCAVGMGDGGRALDVVCAWICLKQS